MCRSHSNYFRDFDPATGWYVESDPIGLAGGSYSTYAYARGNPVTRMDPFGLCDFTPVINMLAQKWKRPPRFKCTVPDCGALHGGTYGPYCPDCNKKSQDPNGGIAPNPWQPPEEDDPPLPNLDDPAPMQMPQLPWWLIFLEGLAA